MDCTHTRTIGTLLNLFETLGHLEKIFFYNTISYLILKTFGDISLFTGEYDKLLAAYGKYSSVYTKLLSSYDSYDYENQCKVCLNHFYSNSNSKTYGKPGTLERICSSCATKEMPTSLVVGQIINNEAKEYHLKSVQYQVFKDASISHSNCEDLEIFAHFPQSPTNEMGMNLSSITIRNAKDLNILECLAYTEKIKSISIAIWLIRDDIATLERVFTKKTFPVLAVFDLHMHPGSSSISALDFKKFLRVFEIISNISTLKSLKLHEHFSTTKFDKSLLSCLLYSSPFFRLKQTSSPFTYLELDSSNIESCMVPPLEDDNVLPDYPIFYWIKKLKFLKTLCIRDIFGLQERIAKSKIEESVTIDIINNDPVIPALAELNAFPLFKYTFNGDVLSDFLPTLQIIANLLPNLEMLNTGGVFIHITRNKTVDFKVVGYTR